MTNNKRYLTPAGYGIAEYVEKRSRFIGQVWLIRDEAEALEHIAKCRETYWDAGHNVYCYRVRDGGIMRYSDDGEPGGTAGMPALNVFQNEKIENFCCVITRYFGGILLGAGGLVRAYAHTAKLALDTAGKSEARLWQRLLVGCSYAQYERIRSELAARGAVTEESDFGADVLLTVLVHAEEASELSMRLVDLTAGTVEIQEMGEEFRSVKL